MANTHHTCRVEFELPIAIAHRVHLFVHSLLKKHESSPTMVPKGSPTTPKKAPREASVGTPKGAIPTTTQERRRAFREKAREVAAREAKLNAKLEAISDQQAQAKAIMKSAKKADRSVHKAREQLERDIASFQATKAAQLSSSAPSIDSDSEALDSEWNIPNPLITHWKELITQSSKCVRRNPLIELEGTAFFPANLSKKDRRDMSSTGFSTENMLDRLHSEDDDSYDMHPHLRYGVIHNLISHEANRGFIQSLIYIHNCIYFNLRNGIRRSQISFDISEFADAWAKGSVGHYTKTIFHSS